MIKPARFSGPYLLFLVIGLFLTLGCQLGTVESVKAETALAHNPPPTLLGPRIRSVQDSESLLPESHYLVQFVYAMPPPKPKFEVLKSRRRLRRLHSELKEGFVRVKVHGNPDGQQARLCQYFADTYGTKFGTTDRLNQKGFFKDDLQQLELENRMIVSYRVFKDSSRDRVQELEESGQDLDLVAAVAGISGKSPVCSSPNWD